jgi:DNA (cytosine-5)-methyltransferase 1
MENVKGILSSRLRGPDGEDAGRVFEQLRRDLSDPRAALANDAETGLLVACSRRGARRYRLYSLVIGGAQSGDQVADTQFLSRAEQFGVPQKRHRVILLGVRDDISTRPTPLIKSGAATVRDAIGTFPPVRSGVSKGDGSWTEWLRTLQQELEVLNSALPAASLGRARLAALARGEVPQMDRGAPFVRGTPLKDGSALGQWYHDPRLRGVIQHEARSHMPSDLARYAFAAAVAEATNFSPKLETWPRDLLPRHRNVRHDHDLGTTKADGFSDRFKVQVWKGPASTVTSHIAKDGHYFIHPDPTQCRSLTVREAARIQTFPDNYYFCGNRTQQYHQVGNAVPPFLACQIAGIVSNLLEEESTRRRPHG